MLAPVLADSIVASSPIVGRIRSLLPPYDETLITDPAGLLAALLTVLAIIFWMAKHPVLGRLFKIVPTLVFCYFVPTALSALGVIPHEAAFYSWVKMYVLLAALLLLTLSLDLPAIVRLGPKPIVMLLTGTAGIVIGGPIALWIWQGYLPEDAWLKMSYLAGSWIGGGANAIALQDSFGVKDVSAIIVVDVAVASVWMGTLLFFAGRHEAVDRWFGGDTSAITALEEKMHDFQESVARIPSLADLLAVLAVGFGFAWLAHLAGGELFQYIERELPKVSEHFSGKIIMAMIVTAMGIGLSFTRFRSLEGAGASRVGSVAIYLLVACIGAEANFAKMWDERWFVALGATWIAVHIVLLLVVGKLIRAPFFFVAVGSQANIGGAASAPVVAGAFNPVLAPVGVLLAIVGYAVGTTAGWLCVQMARIVVGGEMPDLP